MRASDNPFDKSKNTLQKKENAIKTIFLLSTYTIILCAFAIFGKIIVEGTPVLMQKGWSFFTEKPQTLTVLEVEKSEKILAPEKNFDKLLKSNPEKLDLITNIQKETAENAIVTFDILSGSLISDGHLKSLEGLNKGFYVNFKERSKNTPVAFTLKDDKKFSLLQKDFDAVQAFAPQLIPSDVATREVKLNDYKLTIAEGEYLIGKDTHDALVPTNLIFQMRQTFADDDQGREFIAIIPKTQTLVFDSNVYYSAFDEDESGTLPVENEELVPFTRVFKDFSLNKGTYTVAPKVLSALENYGATHTHNLVDGAIAIDEDFTGIEAPVTLWKEILADNPQLKTANVVESTLSEPLVSFTLTKDAELQLDISDREAFANFNKTSGAFKVTAEHTHSYSGGGILGPIVGTGLLVVICMFAALFTGISASVFLNEYAKPGTFVKTIRLAMLNLAGVPSIVFGLFGLGIFVIAAPTVTTTPKTESELHIPLVQMGEAPTMREAEADKIFMVEDQSLSTADTVALAAAGGQKQFYNGTLYLSFQGWGNCMLAGGFTLAIMVLPVIITSCEESLRAVPMGFREASLALGASKWQSIRTAVLPYAFPGILTASVLGITRVAGETAPIMFTAAVAEKSDLPWQGIQATGFDAFLAFLQESVQALPYHIYTVAGRIPQSEYTRPMQFGSVLVFMIIVMTFAAFSVWLRIRVRNKLKW